MFVYYGCKKSSAVALWNNNAFHDTGGAVLIPAFPDHTGEETNATPLEDHNNHHGILKWACLEIRQPEICDTIVYISSPPSAVWMW